MVRRQFSELDFYDCLDCNNANSVVLVPLAFPKDLPHEAHSQEDVNLEM